MIPLVPCVWAAVPPRNSRDVPAVLAHCPRCGRGAGQPNVHGSGSLGFPVLGAGSGGASLSSAVPLPRPTQPRSRRPRCRSCLCSCAPGQMGEVILAGKKNTLLFGGCFNWLFPARSIPCSGSPCRHRAVPGQLQGRMMGELRASALSALNHWGHTQGTGPALW